MTVLVIAEHNNIKLHPSTLNVVTAASQCGGPIHVLIAGYECQAVCDAVEKIQGVHAVVCMDSPCWQHQIAENVTAGILDVIQRTAVTHVMFAATASGKNIAPRLAAMLDVGQISDITSVVSSDTFQRPIYAGSIVATVQSLDTIKVITVRTTAFDAADINPDQILIPQEVINPTTEFKSVAYMGSEIAVSERPDLVSAKIVVSGGRALGSREKFSDLMVTLADKLGAAVGASRAAVDSGYAANDWQVGQTGKIVAPDLYIAVGISGAIQHWAGMKDSGVIVAINSDDQAPIFQLADYSLQADLFVAVPEIISML